MRILFAGTPDFAAEHLRFLLEHGSHDIIGVYTQPDRPAGRGKKVNQSPVKQLAEMYQLPIYQPATLRDEMAQREFRALKPDLFIVVAYGLILPKAILSVPPFGCINVHASLLPRWRGAAPIQRAIEAGDTETGITIMQMDEGLDTGDMLLSVSCNIANDETSATLHDRLLALGGPALEKVLQKIQNKTLERVAQDNVRANYANKISKAEAKIDWSLSAQLLEQKIRAFNPFPVAYFELDGDLIRVWQAKPLQENPSVKPGVIVSSSKEGIKVSTGKNILLLQQLQFPGKKILAVNDILNGHAELFLPGRIL